MAEENNSVILGGYRFTYLSRVIHEGTTTLVYEVKGTGESEAPLESWVLQLCPLRTDLLADNDLLKCMVQQDDEAPFEAVCEKIINEGLPGIRFKESVGAGEDDPAVRFIIMLSGEVDDDCVMLGPEGRSMVYHAAEEDEVVDFSQDCYNCESCPLVQTFRACLDIPDGFSVDAQVEMEAMVTSQTLRAVYEQQKRPAVVLPPYNLMVANAIVVTVHAVGVINVLVKVPIVDAAGEFKASVCAQAVVGVDSPVCCIADDQQTELNAMVLPELLIECPESAGCENRQMCVVTGNVLVRCIEKDL